MRNLALPITMSLGLALGLGLSFGAGCGPSNNGDDAAADDDQPSLTLEVAPADAVLDVVNGAAVTQAYTATLVHPDGAREDVTGQVTFALAASGFGTFDGATLTAPGTAAGVTQVNAVRGDVIGMAQVTVRVHNTRFDGAPANAPELFDNATESAAQAPSLVYPDDHVIVPPNLGEFDVHWNDTHGNDLFEVALKNDYVDLRIYKSGTGALWTTYAQNEWSPLSGTRTPISITVSGLKSGAPGTKGTAPARTMDLTTDDMRGGIYYWATNGSGILRYDTETPNVPPSQLFPGGVPTGCLGCHALSRDGSKIAITFDSAEGRGGVMDLTNNTFLFPYDRGVRWNFATFNPTGTEMIAVKNSVMTVYSADGTTLATVPSQGSMPEISPDGGQLAYVQVSGQDWYAQTGAVYVCDYTEATHTFGAPRMIVPASQNGLQTYYPSWSPDSKWLVITRNNGLSYDNSSSEVWVVKADGSMPPIQLALSNTGGANLTNSWARWVPFSQTIGSTNEEIFFLTFSSKRAFGTRRPSVGSPQIWMTPFYPMRAAAGQDPSGPAIRLPFQSLSDNNHIAQWTERVVIP
ncbi:MAG TPA: hypothetical protein VHE35_05645 [Kofleriaceae bacterium]|nr:hypothetical protein [Kofleriaceae bacterium]